MYHTPGHQYVVDGILLAFGGREAEYEHDSKKTSAIYCFHHDGDQKWKHVGDLPFACSRVDILLQSGGLLMVDGSTQQVLKITVNGKYIAVY